MPLFGRKKPPEPAFARSPGSLCRDPPEPDAEGMRQRRRPPRLPAEPASRSCRRSGSTSSTRRPRASARTSSPRSTCRGFDNSAMDGYAVRAEDVAGQRDRAGPAARSSGEVAGRPAGTAPALARHGDEDHDRRPGARPAPTRSCRTRHRPGRGRRQISAPSESGQHIRRVGEDVEAGTAVLHGRGPARSARHRPAGRHRTGQGAGPAAAPGGGDLDRFRARRPGSAADQRRADLRLELLPAGRGGAGRRGPGVPGRAWWATTPTSVKQLINDQLIRADLILTTGGVSQGDYDIVKAVMPELGACDFASVAMQPGKPQGFGLIGDDRIPMIMLPGNPVSAFVSFEAFVRPVIRKLMGVRPYVRTAVRCLAAHAMNSIAGRLQLARGMVTVTERRRLAGRAGRRPRLAPARRPGAGQRLGGAARGRRVRRCRRRRRRLAAGREGADGPAVADVVSAAPDRRPGRRGWSTCPTRTVTARTATAAGRVLLSAECVAALRDGAVPKGDALAVARIAGIQGAKRTPDLIPLCHPLLYQRRRRERRGDRRRRWRSPRRSGPPSAPGWRWRR